MINPDLSLSSDTGIRDAMHWSGRQKIMNILAQVALNSLGQSKRDGGAGNSKSYKPQMANAKTV